MFLSPVVIIPKEQQRNYLLLRIILYVGVALFISTLALKAFFPTLPFSFDFRNPGASKNTLLDPHAPNATDRKNGKIEADGTLIAYASSASDFSQVRSQINLERDSEQPETLHFSLRRSYRDFWLPTGDPITEFPTETLYVVDGTYYALRENTLYPFVSEQAYLTRYKADQAVTETETLLTKYPLSPNWIGFRIGSLVAYADGVFLITSETETRPVVSAETFLSSGYRFEDVLPGSAEEIGIYTRGKLFLLGVPHPDGTLFFDEDTETTYIIENGFKRAITDPGYRDFLAKQQMPIRVSESRSRESISCTMETGFGRSLSCVSPLDTLVPGYGNDFEVTLGGGDTDIDIQNATVSFETEKSVKNILLFGSKIKERILIRFGASQ